MNDLRPMLERLTPVEMVEWTIEGDSIVVTVLPSSRTQRIRVRREGSHYVFWTMVVASHTSRHNVKSRRDLAVQAWRRNAETELVNFTFDRKERLVGEIRHPCEHLDPMELETYLKILAAEGDRFEYVLTGKDDY